MKEFFVGLWLNLNEDFGLLKEFFNKLDISEWALIAIGFFAGVGFFIIVTHIDGLISDRRERREQKETSKSEETEDA